MKGAAEALGIILTPVGRALVMSEAEFRRVARHIKRQANHVEPATA